MKVYEALRWASSFLNERGLEEPIAEILLKHYLQVDRTKLLQMFHDELSTQILEQYRDALEQISKGVPVQYITGVETFFGRQFMVNENVLIPRPETEELILGLLQRIEKCYGSKQISLVDVGTGSGAIAITLALENKNIDVTTIDISPEAIEVASHNSQKLKADVLFLNGDLLQPIIDSGKKVDVVVSNPPYISESDFLTLDDHVRDHEPKLALVGGETGYELYERLVAQLPHVLKENGIVAFEVGLGQSSQVEALIKEQLPNAITEIVFDINGKDRIVFAHVRK